MSDRTGVTGAELDTEPDDEARPLITARRLARWITVLVVGILAVLALWQDPLHALR